jgi:hypothetical protein
MWYDKLDNTFFLRMLYEEIPLLKNVRIESVAIGYEFKHLRIVFDLPTYPNYPPDKWRNSNTASIELMFSNVTNVEIFKNGDICHGDVEILSVDSGLLIDIHGEGILIKALATDGDVKRISSYVS